MNPQYRRLPQDADIYRRNYLSNLALQISNNQMNWNANQLFASTGVTPTEPADPRSLTDQQADVEGQKVTLRQMLATQLTDFANANRLVDGLQGQDVADMLQMFPKMVAALKPSYSTGCPADVILQWFQNTRAQDARTQNGSLNLTQQWAEQTAMNTQDIAQNMATYAQVQQLINMARQAGVNVPPGFGHGGGGGGGGGDDDDDSGGGGSGPRSRSSIPLQLLQPMQERMAVFARLGDREGCASILHSLQEIMSSSSLASHVHDDDNVSVLTDDWNPTTLERRYDYDDPDEEYWPHEIGATLAQSLAQIKADRERDEANHRESSLSEDDFNSLSSNSLKSVANRGHKQEIQAIFASTRKELYPEDESLGRSPISPLPMSFRPSHGSLSLGSSPFGSLSRSTTRSAINPTDLFGGDEVSLGSSSGISDVNDGSLLSSPYSASHSWNSIPLSSRASSVDGSLADGSLRSFLGYPSSKSSSSVLSGLSDLQSVGSRSLRRIMAPTPSPSSSSSGSHSMYSIPEYNAVSPGSSLTFHSLHSPHSGGASPPTTGKTDVPGWQPQTPTGQADLNEEMKSLEKTVSALRKEHSDSPQSLRASAEKAKVANMTAQQLLRHLQDNGTGPEYAEMLEDRRLDRILARVHKAMETTGKCLTHSLVFAKKFQQDETAKELAPVLQQELVKQSQLVKQAEVIQTKIRSTAPARGASSRFNQSLLSGPFNTGNMTITRGPRLEPDVFPGRGPNTRGITGRITGKGFKQNIDTTSEGTPEQKSYVAFGKHFIHRHRLNHDNILQVRCKSGRAVMHLPTQKISGELSHVLVRLIGSNHPTFEDMQRLADSDKTLLNKIIRVSKIDDRLMLPTPERSEEDQQWNRFQVLVGEMQAGNNATELVKELKGLLLKMAHSNRLPRRQVHDILLDLTALGH